MTSPDSPRLSEPECAAAARLIELAFAEDFGERGDLTCSAMIDPALQAEVLVAARQPGRLSGGPVGKLVFKQLDPRVTWTTEIPDGAAVAPGDVVARVSGPLRSLLSGERTALNFMTHLSGIATLTARFVQAVEGTGAVILDTRKTLPGYRLLQKYAVRCGGGVNHRLGLYDGVLIKDNHLAAWSQAAAESTIAAAVRTARAAAPEGLSIEVEVDTLDQLEDALQGGPDIVLLDNMSPQMLREAVQRRNQRAPAVLLEASGGVTLETVRAIAETGVDRISVGGLTHSARILDLAFDWSTLTQSTAGGDGS